MRITWTLTKVRMRLALRNRAFIFFSVAMPLAFLFLYLGLLAPMFARGRVEQMRFYMLPAVLALTVMGSFWGLSIQLVMFREQGVLRRFRLAPVGAAAMLASSVLSNYVLTLPTLVIELLLSHWLFRVPDFGNLWGVFVFATLGTVAFASFGLIVASITSTIQETQVINNAIWFVLLFFSGATFPLVAFPGWLQRASMFLPATHLIVGLQYVMVAAAPTLRVDAEIIALAGGSLMAFFVSWKLFRWEPEERVTRRAKLWAVAVVVPFLLLGAWENAADSRRNELQQIYRSVLQPSIPGSGSPAER